MKIPIPRLIRPYLINFPLYSFNVNVFYFGIINHWNWNWIEARKTTKPIFNIGPVLFVQLRTITYNYVLLYLSCSSSFFSSISSCGIWIYFYLLSYLPVLYILTSMWVLCTLNAGQSFCIAVDNPQHICRTNFWFAVSILIKLL